MKRVILAAAAAVVALPAVAKQTFMPPNSLHLEPVLAPRMSKAEFDATIDKAVKVYAPLMKEAYGATLLVDRRWNDETVNASAEQVGPRWYLHMYGGLARRISSTDGFLTVICHELGHHLGGYPYVQFWAANEGQSDYFATLSCFRNLTRGDDNSAFAKVIPQYPKAQCDKAWEGLDDRNLCYRAMMAGLSTAELLSGGRSQVRFETPDQREILVTNDRHPMAQCRLDTYMAGAVCPREFDTHVIPAKSLGSQHNSAQAEREAAQQSCHKVNGDAFGLRPKCWFASKL